MVREPKVTVPTTLALPVKEAADTDVPAACVPAALPPVTVVTTLPLTQATFTPMPETPTAGMAKPLTEPAEALAVKMPSPSATAPVLHPELDVAVDQATP